jgi:hypothetical protein
MDGFRFGSEPEEDWHVDVSSCSQHQGVSQANHPMAILHLQPLLNQKARQLFPYNKLLKIVKLSSFLGTGVIEKVAKK